MYGADFDPSDIDVGLDTHAEDMSANVDMSEWFDPDIAYFTTEDKATKCTPSKKSTLNQAKKQSAASQMRELSRRLGREQAVDRSATNTVQRLPVKSGLSGRKRLIDNMFDEIFDPKVIAQPLTKQCTPMATQITTIQATPSIKSTPQISMPTPQLAKKPRIEDSFYNVPDTHDPPRVAASTQYTDAPRVAASTRYTDAPRVAASTRYTDAPRVAASTQYTDAPRVAASTQYTDAPRVAASTQYTDATLSKKLSSQMQQTHNHTEACSHTMLEQHYEGHNSFTSSLYDAESEGKSTSTTSFFTAGPVW